MKNTGRKALSFVIPFVAFSMCLNSCADDPKPVNQEELITTVVVELTPSVPGTPTVILRYFDEDGIGTIDPVVTVNHPLNSEVEYTGEVQFLNESISPAENITEEIVEEANDHLVCYTIEGAGLEIESVDSDDNARPIGLSTLWSSLTPSTGTITLTLRHQPGTKTGVCPGPGESDVEVSFPITIQ